MFDKKKRYWFAIDANNYVHNDMITKAYRQGLYPEFNSEYEAQQYFDENYMSDNEYLIRFKATKYGSENELQSILQEQLDQDEYKTAYSINTDNNSGYIIFARSDYDLQDTPLKGLENISVRWERNPNKTNEVIRTNETRLYQYDIAGQKVIDTFDENEPDNAIVKSKNGNYSHGIITQELADIIGTKKEGNIIVYNDLNKHIDSTRKSTILAQGYTDLVDFIDDTINTWEKVYEGKKGSILIVKEGNKDNIVAVRLEEEKGFYKTSTVILSRKDYLKNKKVLAERAQSNQFIKSPGAFSGTSTNSNIQNLFENVNNIYQQNTNGYFDQELKTIVIGSNFNPEQIVDKMAKIDIT